MNLTDRIKSFIALTGFKVIVSNTATIKYGLLNPINNYNICNWYTTEELLLFLELYEKKVEIIKIEETISIIQEENKAQEQTEEIFNGDIYAKSILQLIKAVSNLKEFSLLQQSQLINLFK